MAGEVEARLAQLGVTLPEATAPLANYIPFVRSGDLVFISGQISKDDSGLILGKLGAGCSVEDGRRAARACALSLIAILRNACDGDLDRVRRVVKLTGFVNSADDFTEHPQVINAASDLFAEAFGAAAPHSRAAVGVASLPLGVAVEIEGVFETA